MPPFGVEKEEKKSLKAPFLSLKSHDPVRPTDSGVTGPFGAETSEQSSTGARSNSAQSRKPPGTRSTVLWGAEPEENEQANAGPASESSSSESETVYRGTSQTVFSMGWHSMMDLKKASFWKENIDGDGVRQKKRKYNNTSRAAVASYTRKNNAGQFKNNGVDPGRIQRLFRAESCQCYLVGCVHQFSSKIFKNHQSTMTCLLNV